MENIFGGRPYGEDTYENYLAYCNRDRRLKQKVECECGKTLYESKLERHLKSDLHKRLLQLKERCMKIREEKEKRMAEIENVANRLKQEKDEIQRLEEQRLKRDENGLKNVSFTPEQMDVINQMFKTFISEKLNV